MIGLWLYAAHERLTVLLCFITMNELFCRQLIVNLVSSLINSTSTDSEEMSEDSDSNSDEEIFVNTPNKKKSRVNIKKTNCSMSSLNAWYQVKLLLFLLRIMVMLAYL